MVDYNPHARSTCFINHPSPCAYTRTRMACTLHDGQQCGVDPSRRFTVRERSVNECTATDTANYEVQHLRVGARVRVVRVCRWMGARAFIWICPHNILTPSNKHRVWDSGAARPRPFRPRLFGSYHGHDPFGAICAPHGHDRRRPSCASPAPPHETEAAKPHRREDATEGAS